jgi:hypothetical protein
MKPSTYLFGTESPQWMYPEWSIKTQIVAGSGWSGAALIEAYEPSITGDAYRCGYRQDPRKAESPGCTGALAVPPRGFEPRFPP